MDVDNGVGIDYGGWPQLRKAKGENWNNSNRITIILKTQRERNKKKEGKINLFWDSKVIKVQ